MNLNKIKAIRTELGLTQKEFANLCAIPYSTYAQHESGIGDFKLKDVKAIHKAANDNGIKVSYEELIA